MAWTTPRTYVAGETLTAAILNADVRDNWNAAFPVGSLHWRMQVETGVETVIDGFALEGNGVNVTRTTYSALNTKLSGLSYPFGAGNGTTTMTLPDLRGRSPFMAGSHSEMDLGDNDGVSESSRTPIHNSTDNLAISPDPHSHTYIVPDVPTNTYAAGGNAGVPGRTGSWPSDTTALSITGSVGPGGTRPNDRVPFLVVGVMAVKF